MKKIALATFLGMAWLGQAGNGNVIIGNGNRFNGNNNLAKGNNNLQLGDQTKIVGSNNVNYGDNREIYGNNHYFGSYHPEYQAYTKSQESGEKTPLPQQKAFNPSDSA